MRFRIADFELRIERPPLLRDRPIRISHFAFRNAFTLTEILVIIGIMVLLLGIGAPMFNFIIGSRSIDGAANVVSAALGQARAQARGLQSTVGVCFFVDPPSKRTAMVIVGDDPNSADPRFIDVVPGFDLELLPAGISAQFVHNCSFDAGGNRTSDGYIRQPAAILFGGHGQLISTTYAIRAAGRLGQLMELSVDFSPPSAQSQFGMVLYDTESFVNQGFDDSASFTTSPYNAAKDTWLDRNATPYLVNRYNGTLIKTENTP